MRFALITTAVAAAVAMPFALAAAGPQMAPGEFVSAVRCTAFEQVVAPQQDLGAIKMQLNGEARRQAPDVAQRARADAAAIAQAAVNIESPADMAMMRAHARSACAQADVLAGAAQADMTQG